MRQKKCTNVNSSCYHDDWLRRTSDCKEEAVSKKIEDINTSPTYGTTKYEMPEPVAKRVAEIFRVAGWNVKVEENPRWITFAWDQSMAKKQ